MSKCCKTNMRFANIANIEVIHSRGGEQGADWTRLARNLVSIYDSMHPATWFCSRIGLNIIFVLNFHVANFNPQYSDPRVTPQSSVSSTYI
jgi:hypothetical protein